MARVVARFVTVSDLAQIYPTGYGYMALSGRPGFPASGVPFAMPERGVLEARGAVADPEEEGYSVRLGALPK